MNQPMRRKKTVEEIKAYRLRKDREAVVVKKQSKELCWDDLTSLYVKCRTALSTIDPVVIVMRNDDIMGMMSNEDKVYLSKKTMCLLRDVHIFKDTLGDIFKKHEGKTGGEDNPMLLIDSLTIGEEYQNWLSSYQDVVVVAVGDILDFVETKTTPQPTVA